MSLLLYFLFHFIYFTLLLNNDELNMVRLVCTGRYEGMIITFVLIRLELLSFYNIVIE